MAPVDSQYRRALAIIASTAFLLRIAILIFAEARPAFFDFPDSHRYICVARNIAEGHGPIDSVNMRSGTDPLYPLILSAAPIAGFNGESEILRFGRICNSAFSMASVLLLAGIGRRLFNPRNGLIAAAILAADPILLFFNALVLTESLFIMLLLTSYYAIVRLVLPQSELARASAHQTRPVVWTLLAGSCLGAAILARSTGLFLPLMLAPIVAFVIATYRSPASNRKPLSAAMILAITAYFILTPVVIRNYGLYQKIVPARIGGGASLMEALGPWADGSPGMDRIKFPEFPPDADEYERDRQSREAAFKWAFDHPKETINLAFVKLKRTWSIEINAAGYTSPLLRAICWASVAPVFLLALFGIWLTRKRPALLALLLAPAVYFTLIHMVFVGSVRYRLPAMPILFLLAAVAVDALLPRRRPAIN